MMSRLHIATDRKHEKIGEWQPTASVVNDVLSPSCLLWETGLATTFCDDTRSNPAERSGSWSNGLVVPKLTDMLCLEARGGYYLESELILSQLPSILRTSIHLHPFPSQQWLREVGKFHVLQTDIEILTSTQAENRMRLPIVFYHLLPQLTQLGSLRVSHDMYVGRTRHMSFI
jgi:hypothetical protein